LIVDNALSVRLIELQPMSEFAPLTLRFRKEHFASNSLRSAIDRTVEIAFA
jgi:hypothetical protein